MRIGFGYDSHRFGEGGRLMLGGVEFPELPALEAHSDGDSLVHAVIDALLGAAALGDIGAKFPDDDPSTTGADSGAMLTAVMREVRAAGFRLANLDATVIAERPRLKPAVPLIRERLAALMGVGIGRISVKGKTNEGMDAVGRGEGVVVHAAVLLE